MHPFPLYNPYERPIRLSENITGICIPKPKPRTEQKLSYRNLIEFLDYKEALKIAFIPHFVIQGILYYLNNLVDYAVNNRIAELKKPVRLLKELRDDYDKNLQMEMSPKVYKRFLELRQEYLSDCGGNLARMYFTYGNSLLKRYGKIDHESVYCFAHIIISLAEYIVKFDSDANKRIASASGKPCQNNGDARLDAICTVCRNIVRNYPLPSDPQTELCVKVIATKAESIVIRMTQE